MAMVVKNNLSALNTLNKLNVNNSELAKSLKKVSSGMRINGAGDDASSYSISERMQVRIRGLGQCDSNTKTGKNMITLAERAVNEQVQIAQKLKEIALKATDDTYSQVDRDVLQTETTQLLMQMNEISYETNYNGQQLLALTKPGKQVTSFDAEEDMTDNRQGVEVVPAPNNHVSGTTPSYTGYGPDMYKRVGQQQVLYDASTVVPVPVTGFSDIGQNAKIYDSSGNQYTVVSDPNTRVLSVVSGGTYTPIVINGSDSRGNPATGIVPANVEGYAQLTNPQPGAQVKEQPFVWQSNNPAYALDVENYDPNQLILVGAGSLSSQLFDLSGLSSLSLPGDLDDQGFSIMCTGCEQFVSVKFDADMPAGTGQYYKTTNGTSDSEAYVVGIRGLTTTGDVEKAVFDGILNATGSSSNPVTITGRHNVEMREYNGKYYLTKYGPSFSLYNGFKGSIKTVGGKLPYGDYFIQGDTKSSQETRLLFPNTTLNILFPSEDSDWDIEPTEEDYPAEWPSEYDRLDTEDQKRAKWRDEVWPYPRKGAVASASCVRTREKANKFLGDIDQAINYLLHAATNLGAQAQRMDAMNDNIVTGNENTQGAESTIRDADMAKEMMTYTKNNVLTQSAQSMLSQANQNTGGVLDLLQ